MRRQDYHGLRSKQYRSKRGGSWRGSMRLGLLFAVLVGINVYVFFFRGGTSIQDILKASAIKKSGEDAAQKLKADPESGDDVMLGGKAQVGTKVIKGSIKGHLGLAPALASVKLNQEQTDELVAALRPVLDMRTLQPRHQFEVHLDPASGNVRKFIYRLSKISAVVATRGRDGTLRARKAERKLDVKRLRLAGMVKTSLDQAILAKGEAYSLVSRFVSLLSYDINWYADPREDDEFRIIVEKRYLGGKFFGYGKMVGAEYKGILGRRQVFYYTNRAGKGGYYTPEGRSVNRTFLKMPLNYRRVSSSFDRKRYHPVLHRTKGHYGVDYAADPGTPVWATADGTVTKSGRFGGAGKMVQLSHKNHVSTVYMHFSRIARGIKAGRKVRQRQVIGYVGSTGLASGPHLHYGIYVRGKYVDPMKFDGGKGPLLPKNERLRFLDKLPDLRADLESISLE